MMTILITAITVFGALFLFAVVFGLFSVIVAYVVARTVPRATDVCYRYVIGWTTKRGLRNRFFLAPLGIMFALFAIFAVVGLTATHRVRSTITESTRLIVRSGGNCHRNPERERVLFETEDSEVIERFAEQISLGLGMMGMHCMCCGEMTFDLYNDQDLHYSFSLHHGQSIRIEESSLGDRELSFSSRRRLKVWLDQAGVTKAHEEVREEEEQKMKAEIQEMKRSAQPEDTPASE